MPLTLFVGGFNAQIGAASEGLLQPLGIGLEDIFLIAHMSMDSKYNKQRLKFLEFLYHHNLYTLRGSAVDQSIGRFTYLSEGGGSAIDHVMVSPSSKF